MRFNKLLRKSPRESSRFVEEGLVDEVICQLMSGKEAMVYVVRCGMDIRCAKVYKEIDKRSFRHNAAHHSWRFIEIRCAGKDGLVIIDLPQAVDAASNSSAYSLLLRDVDNLTRYFGYFAPELLKTDYGNEIWFLYRKGNLHPDVHLSGSVQRTPFDTCNVTRAAKNVLSVSGSRAGRQ